MKKNATQRLRWVSVAALGIAALAASVPANARDCENVQIEQAVREVAGREPQAAECSVGRWGCWQSYGEVRGRVYHEIGRPSGLRPATQKLLRSSGNQSICLSSPIAEPSSASYDPPKANRRRAAEPDPAVVRAAILMLLVGSYVSR